jgi:hypothetical protein
MGGEDGLVDSRLVFSRNTSGVKDYNGSLVLDRVGIQLDRSVVTKTLELIRN